VERPQPAFQAVNRLAFRSAIAAAAVLAIGAAPAQAQLVAKLHADAQLYYHPDVHSPRGLIVRARRPLTGTATVLPVLKTKLQGGRRFLYVLLPGRPNSHAGWIIERRVSLERTPWKVVVRTEQRRLYVLRRGRIVTSFAAVVGSSATPTPQGRFFVEETLVMAPGSPGWPYAFALSARSTVYREFEGGPGQVAIHGTYGIGGVPGTAASHGCVRLESAALRWLARHVGSGTPVIIRG
jgi:lipoprotein-anchoring transpeptidase ErfK/SrfK